MKNINKIFNEGPKDQLWDRLEEKLNSRKSSKRLKIYKVTTIAAMFVALIAAVGYLNHVLNDHNPHLFASNGDFSSFVTEDLAHAEEGLFNMESLLFIRKAYNRQLETSQSPNLVGNYKAKGGALSISIKLHEFSYTLDFSFDDFPSFYLEKMEGQTLYFASDIDKSIKMNIEPYGLRLIESDFLPEYAGYQFNRLSEI